MPARLRHRAGTAFRGGTDYFHKKHNFILGVLLSARCVFTRPPAPRGAAWVLLNLGVREANSRTENVRKCTSWAPYAAKQNRYSVSCIVMQRPENDPDAFSGFPGVNNVFAVLASDPQLYE